MTRFQETFRILLLPIRGKINISPTDQAIYIGTLEFKRDEFGAVEKVKVIDEYDQALVEYQKKFGNNLLKKSLIQIME